MKLVIALQLAGMMHLGLIAAGAMMPRVVKLRSHIVALPPFIRRLFWVYYSFIGLFLLSFGTLSVFLAPQLESGTALARALCGFLAIFWIVRLFVAAFVFDVNPYLTNAFWKMGYRVMNVVFALLPVIYGWAALAGGEQ